MRDSFLKVGFGLFFLMLFSTTASAQDSRVEELEKKLVDRDMVILELLERVEALEQRVGVKRVASQDDVQSSHVNKKDVEFSPGNAPDELADTAPGTVVVQEGDVERALERSLTRAGALLLSPGILELEPGFRFARQEDSAPSLLMMDGGFVAGETELNANSLTADLGIRLGLPWDSQLEFGLPYRWRTVESVNKIGFAPIESSNQSGAGLGDLRIGFAKTLLREGLWRPDIVGRIVWDTDSGELEDSGVPLGGGFNELRVSLMAIKRQDPIVFVGDLSYEHSFEEGRIQPGSAISAAFGSYIALSPETSMRFLFTGGYQYETELGGVKVAGSDRTVASFIIGGTTLLVPGLSMNLAAEIGLTEEADDFAISMSFPFRFNSPLY